MRDGLWFAEMVCGNKVLPGASLPVFNILFRHFRGSKAKLWPMDPQVVGSSAGRGARTLTEAYCGEGTEISVARQKVPR